MQSTSVLTLMNADHRLRPSVPPIQTAAPCSTSISGGNVGFGTARAERHRASSFRSTTDGGDQRKDARPARRNLRRRFLQRGRRQWNQRRRVVQLPAVSLAQGIASAPGDQRGRGSQRPSADTDRGRPGRIADGCRSTEPTADTRPRPSKFSRSRPPSRRPTGPTARVLVDPGVNLQLRQYPQPRSLLARSCALRRDAARQWARGRAGSARRHDRDAAPPEATDFVDPVTLLQEGEDLDPVTDLDQRHLRYARWRHDHRLGQRALSRHSRLHRDARMALRDLPTVPSNRAGEAQDTAIQPPSARGIVTMAIATNVKPGVRIHIRRLPTIEGESLALVPAGTQMELLSA